MKKRNLAIAIILSATVGLFAIKSALTPVDEESVVTNTDIAEIISTDTLTLHQLMKAVRICGHIMIHLN